MSNAKKILENTTDSEYLKGKPIALEAMETYKNQTLQELKAKVEKMKDKSVGEGDLYNEVIDDVIEKIYEVIND